MNAERRLQDELNHARRQLRAVREAAPEDRATISYFEELVKHLGGQLDALRKALRERREGATYAPGTKTLADVSVDQAKALIAAGMSANGSVGLACRELWRRIERHGLRVVHGYHVGGNPERPDFTVHVTVTVDRTYHLRVNRKGVIFDISPRLAPAYCEGPGARPWEKR